MVPSPAPVGLDSGPVGLDSALVGVGLMDLLTYECCYCYEFIRSVGMNQHKDTTPGLIFRSSSL